MIRTGIQFYFLLCIPIISAVAMACITSMLSESTGVSMQPLDYVMCGLSVLLGIGTPATALYSK